MSVSAFSKVCIIKKVYHLLRDSVYQRELCPWVCVIEGISESVCLNFFVGAFVTEVCQIFYVWEFGLQSVHEEVCV